MENYNDMNEYYVSDFKETISKDKWDNLKDDEIFEDLIIGVRYQKQIVDDVIYCIYNNWIPWGSGSTTALYVGDYDNIKLSNDDNLTLSQNFFNDNPVGIYKKSHFDGKHNIWFNIKDDSDFIETT